MSYNLPVIEGKASDMVASTAKSPTPRRASTRARPAPSAARTDGNLVMSFMGADGMLDFDGITRSFGMSKSQLAETAGLGRDTLQKDVRRRAAKTQSRVREMLEIVARIEIWAGGQTQAMAWYRSQPIAALDGRTAEALVRTGKAGDVRTYLDHIALGGFA